MAEDANLNTGDAGQFPQDNSAASETAIHEHRPVPVSDPVEQGTGKLEFCELRAGGTYLAIETSIGMRPIILYAGPDLPGAAASELALLATRQHAPGSASVPLRGSLLNEIGTGISGPSRGLKQHRSVTQYAWLAG